MATDEVKGTKKSTVHDSKRIYEIPSEEATAEELPAKERNDTRQDTPTDES